MTSETLGETGKGRRLVIWGVVLLLLAALTWLTFGTGVGTNEDVISPETGELAALGIAAAGLVAAISGLVLVFKDKTPAS